jgi:protein-S-isoprenylcysteine O-methyltransferase Ste14
MRGFPDLPPIWWLGSIAAIYLFKFVAPGLHPDIWWLDALSWLVLFAAVCIIGWSAWYFFANRTPIEPHHTPKSLIISGPYRVSRNPIYLALVLLTLASAMGHSSLLGIVLAGVLWWVLDRRFAGPEEALLRQTFGAEADAYIAQTRRWI